MTKDRFERRAYRRSPGRQYGYDYDPLHSNRGGTDQNSRSNSSEADERWNTRSNRSAVQFAPRPDPRRTRQLLRQSILAGKFHSSPLPEDDLQQHEDEMQAPSSPTLTDRDQSMYEGQDDSTLYSNRYRARHNHTEQPQAPTPA
ncbi:MAG: hypothetical protein NVS4B7_06170 [Ktedonobacteraceae bacterium]